MAIAAPTEFDFSNLSPLQRQLLDAGGWQLGRGKQPGKTVVRKLVQRGLLMERKRRFMLTEVPEYFMPTGVAEAWFTARGKAS